MQQVEIKEFDEIDKKIIEENNYEMRLLSEDLINLSEIFHDLACMLNLQGEKLDITNEKIGKIENDVSVTVKSLENTEKYVVKFNQILREAGIIVGGISLGTLGFFGGPVIGAITLISGAVTSSGIVFAARKIQ